jgi:dolichol-phosphate mannosyltransferase
MQFRRGAGADESKAPLRPNVIPARKREELAEGANGAPAPALSVVIPVHDEAENIGGLLEEVRRALGDVVPFEIVVIDDASPDDTVARLDACSSVMPELRVVCHRRNAGQSTAVHTGVRTARGALVATLDGDGQNDPADIPALLARYREAADGRPVLIAGQRTRRQDSFVRRASSRIANAARSRVLRDQTPDTGCGLKLFARSDFLALPYFDHMHRYLPALVLRSGGRVLSVPVNHRPRGGGRSHYGIRNRLLPGIVDMIGVAWLMRRSKLPEAVERPRPVRKVGA